MKHILYIALTLAMVSGCQPQNPEQTPTENTTSEPEQGDNPSVFIKDSADYSIHFLEEMDRQGMHDLSLVDSFLILGPTDTVNFPQIPAIGTQTTLTAKQGELAIALTVERINQTTIKYQIEMVEFGKASHNYQGQAHLNPHFYFGSETDESSLSGIFYLSTEFTDSKDSCYTYIRLGREEASGPYLLGKLIKNCNGKIRNIGLDSFPTLVEK